MSGDAGETPFKGGFRIEPPEDDGGACWVDVWGADISELLPRVLEAASQAGGGVERSTVRALQSFAGRSKDLAGLVATFAAMGLATPVVRASCDSAPSEDDAETAGLTAMLRGETVAPGADRIDLEYVPQSASVWREDPLVRARFQVRPR